MPEIGIIGFERSGKTSFFNAVTGAQHPVGFSTHPDPHVGVAKVPDSRLDQLTALFQPRKHTPADLQYVDFPGLGFAGGRGPAPRFLQQLSLLDAFIHVVRAFENEAAPPPDGGVDPARDIEAMTLELVFADLDLVDKRLQRIAAETKALKASEREQAQREAELLRRVHAQLEAGVPCRAIPLAQEERQSLRQYRFLTDRPLLTLLNINEADASQAEAIATRYRPAGEPPGTATGAACAALEMELQALAPEEAADYRRQVGGGEGALDQAVRFSYEILGLISFFTVGPDECRAWSIRRGTTAQASAGKIHTDLERGFIRAEVVDWHDLTTARSEAEAKKRALMHTEGKDYVVQDGDVLHVLFNV